MNWVSRTSFLVYDELIIRAEKYVVARSNYLLFTHTQYIWFVIREKWSYLLEKFYFWKRINFCREIFHNDFSFLSKSIRGDIVYKYICLKVLPLQIFQFCYNHTSFFLLGVFICGFFSKWETLSIEELNWSVSCCLSTIIRISRKVSEDFRFFFSQISKYIEGAQKN